MLFSDDRCICEGQSSHLQLLGLLHTKTSLLFLLRGKRNGFFCIREALRLLKIIFIHFDPRCTKMPFVVFWYDRTSAGIIVLFVIRFIIIQRSAVLSSALRFTAAFRPFGFRALAPLSHPIKRGSAVASASVSFRDRSASRIGFTLQIYTTSYFAFWQVFFLYCNLTETLQKKTGKYYRKQSQSFIRYRF